MPTSHGIWHATSGRPPGVDGEHHGALVVRTRERAVNGQATTAALPAAAADVGVRHHPVILIKGTLTQAEIGTWRADPAVRPATSWGRDSHRPEHAPYHGITAASVTCQPTLRLIAHATGAIRGISAHSP
jgi:hypothetical protein